MVILEKEKRKGSGNDDSWVQTNFLEPYALLGDVKLLLIVEVVRIWFQRDGR
jgi:hypothetical protein